MKQERARCWRADAGAFALLVCAGLAGHAGPAAAAPAAKRANPPAAKGAAAPFAQAPAAQPPGEPQPSGAEAEKEYRVDAARHLYAAYPKRVYRGKLPPLLYSVMAVETEIDAASGEVVDVRVVRKPAADEVAPWVVAMIRGAGPYPVAARIGTGNVRYFEIWLVDRSGQFQVDSLTEGQR